MYVEDPLRRNLTSGLAPRRDYAMAGRPRLGDALLGWIRGCLEGTDVSQRTARMSSRRRPSRTRRSRMGIRTQWIIGIITILTVDYPFCGSMRCKSSLSFGRSVGRSMVKVSQSLIQSVTRSIMKLSYFIKRDFFFFCFVIWFSKRLHNYFTKHKKEI